MEKYIKGLEKLVILVIADVIKYKDKVLEKTKMIIEN